MILPRNPNEWGGDPRFELEERIAILACARREDPAKPSRETCAQAVAELRERWLDVPGEAETTTTATTPPAEREQPTSAPPGPPAATAMPEPATTAEPPEVVLLAFGGRDYDDRERLFAALDKSAAMFKPTVLRHGAAPGADSLAGEWARSRGLTEQAMPADWDQHGQAAGPMRNSAMLTREPFPVAAVGFPGGRGTADMAAKCKAAGVRLWMLKAR